MEVCWENVDEFSFSDRACMILDESFIVQNFELHSFQNRERCGSGSGNVWKQNSHGPWRRYLSNKSETFENDRYNALIVRDHGKFPLLG